MLLPSEKDCVNGYSKLFQDQEVPQYQHVCVIGQNPTKRPTYAHEDGSLPTFLKNSGSKFWSSKRHRWLTAKEKWAAMGWPCSDKLAELFQRPTVDPYLTKKPHERIGNAMHLHNLAMVITAVFTCIEAGWHTT